MLARNDLAQYIADNYGRCTQTRCKCLKDGWLGCACPNWQPVKAATWEELREEMLRPHEGR